MFPVSWEVVNLSGLMGIFWITAQNQSRTTYCTSLILYPNKMTNISISAQRFPWGFLILSYIRICGESAVPENCWVNLCWHSFIQYIEAVSRALLQERSLKLNLNLGLKSNTWQWHHNTLSPALLFCLTYISADPFCLSFPFCDPPELPFWTRWPHASLSLSQPVERDVSAFHFQSFHHTHSNNELWNVIFVD